MAKKEINILVIGSDGATHALLWKLYQSPIVRKIYCFPGREGFRNIPKLTLASVANESQIYDFAKAKDIHLVIIRSEEDLAKGMADRFLEFGIKVYGPGKKAVWLEADKGEAKKFMARHGIPTPRFFIANNLEEAELAIDEIGDDVVVKAAYLSKGKGATVFSDKKEAQKHAKWLLNGGLGSAGRKLVIEQRLYGDEASVILNACGKGYNLFPIIRDYKRVLDGDEGLNTGGAGGYGPVAIPPHIMEKVERELITPTFSGLQKEKIDFRGTLYLGIMITPDGKVWILEFNIRLGDPETESQMLLLDDDLATIMYSAAIGKMHKKKIETKKGYAVCIVAMAENYPGKPVTGDVITGLESIVKDENHVVFHANTVKEDSVWKTAGGRVLAFVAFAETLEKAIKEAYEMVGKVHFRGMHFRRDIGQKGLEAKNIY